ncbi:MAG: DUF971 domain-containing protein [Verrucomicrobiae bacterium]|nr:DUF971 domain-containing protein [Verrucomicrobiae bacterium]MCP5539148.1 DUF971 domain-containing protein [Akkermansiaceae bacterium]MCP5549799.1 DUF971 domain-containing protein [Akkermansiaceae bacterium]
MIQPEIIQAIGNEIAIRWADGVEDYVPMDRLRALSPSAETQGEHDLFGNLIGGQPGRDYTGVTVTGWRPVGGYAVQFDFSDGHRTGLYSFEYLRQIGEALRGAAD